jgi:superkiller protein 3
VAAMKTLTHARELVPDDWTCEYLIGDVQRQMGLYEPAIAAFGVILESRPTESGILLSLAESHLALGREENSTGFVVRSERSFCSAISSSVRLIDSSPGFRSLAWKVLADSLFELSKFVEYTDPEAVRDTLSPVADTLVGDAASAQKVVKDSESMKSIRQQLSNAPDTSVVLRLCIASYDYRLSLSRRNGNTVGSALYDLSVALYTLSLTLDAGKRKTREDEAAQLVKEALRHDPGNEVYWNALAILNLESNPKLAQHAFIKALEFESKVRFSISYFFTSH